MIINSDGLRRCIERNVVQGVSRALAEEVAFDRAKVTSTDWLSNPILDITEAPDAVDIVLMNRPELPPAGAGESSIRPVAAAIANVVFNATGVFLRRAPLTPKPLKPALAQLRSASRDPCAAASIKARDRAVVRGGAIAEVEHDFVDVTPAPAFGRVIAFDDWMTRLVKMLGGVAVRRIVATADMTAGPA
jgi:hypothetical protein